MKKNINMFILMMCVGLLTFFGLKLTFAAEKNIAGDPGFYINAVNPGYVIDGKSNVGEMIEIRRKRSDEMVSLAGLTVGYTNSSGNKTVLFEFPENSFMVGESILLRLASSPDSELANVNYTKTLALKGSLSLEKDSEIIDSVCWSSKDGCLKEFKTANPTSLVRDFENIIFNHVSDYVPLFDESSYYIESIDEGIRPAQCRGLEFSEILSYYDNSQTEQFIEIYNSNSEQILMNGCKIRYKNKLYNLEGIVGAERYHLYYPVEFALTKNPANRGTIELIDVNDEIIDRVDYFNGQRRGTSLAFIGHNESGEEIWRITYAPTPGEANNYQEFKTCEAGKVINEVTGNCVKVVNVTEKICNEGYYLNVLTGRCKKIETPTVKTCKEGYYLNPETNRCKKIQENTGANYDLKPESYQEESFFVALYAVIGIVLIGLAYLAFEFRKEIAKLFGKVFRRFH